ncbi:MAG: cytochrome C [Sulfuritalea sp.]|jgi:mono/diheme cytochrome c family protein|nr:cytochrome C [Sulfuritalea sp.]
MLWLPLLAVLLPLAALAGERPRTNFLLHCSGCHQPDGSGSAQNGIPNMKDRVGHFLRLPEGRAFLVQVPGTAQSSLGDGETAELLNWMVVALSPHAVPANLLPYTRDEVARLRATPLNDVAAVRASVVGRLQQMGYKIE